MKEEQAKQELTEDQAERRKLSRRRLIHILATGGAITSAKLMPDQWIKPVVDSIIMPVHAAGSRDEPNPENLAPSLDPSDFSPQQIQYFINDLSPEQRRELESQLTLDEVDRLNEFLE